MDWERLDSLIGKFSSLVEQRRPALIDSSEYIPAPSYLVFRIGGITRCDWKPVWEMAEEIQGQFNAKVMYPTKQLRDQAWTRFNNLRNEASALANTERENFQSLSEDCRNRIIDTAEGARYHPIDDVIFFFDPTTVEDMKRRGARLNEAGRMLSEGKRAMRREHKDECFQRMQDVRASHEVFWSKYRDAKAQRRQHHEDKRTEILRRIAGNLDKNRERLAKAEDALARVEANIADLHDKISEARSDEWRDRFEVWLVQAEEKRESIRELISRLQEWIDQDEQRQSQVH